MTANFRLLVEVEWLPSGQFFFYPDTQQVMGMEQVAYVVFAWDRRSFYGTMVNLAENNGRKGFLLSAKDGVDYFSDQGFNHEVEVEFDLGWENLHHAARQISNALRRGAFAPDFLSWQSGIWRWKRVNSEGDPDNGLPFFRDWFHYTTLQTIEQNREVAVAWETVQEQYPVISSVSPAVWAEEAEWWIALGLLADPTPFQIGLALLEPDSATPPGSDQNPAGLTPGDGDAARAWRFSVVLHDKADETMVFSFTDEDLQPKPGNGQIQPGLFPEAWLPYLEVVEKATRRWLTLAPALADGDGHLKMRLTEQEALDFLRADSATLMEAGERVYLPNWWEEAKRLRARLKAKVRSSVGTRQQSIFGVQQIVQFDWSAAIGDLELTPEEFSRLLTNQRRLVEIRGRWVVLDPEFYMTALQKMGQVNRAGGLTLRDVLELHLLGANPLNTPEQGSLAGSGDATLEAGLDPASDADRTSVGQYDVQLEVELNEALHGLLAQLQDARGLATKEEPPGFQGHLRPYQRLGYSWLTFLRQFGLGACLADDMGLGKTVQYIAYLTDIAQSRSESQHMTQPVQFDPAGEAGLAAGSADSATDLQPPTATSLLICPTSVIGNWERELRRFAPSLRVYVHYGSNRKRGEGFVQAASEAHLVLTTYGLANLDEQHLAQLTWDSLCLDEAQNIKNAYTKQAAAIRGLTAHHRIAMTGTPIENRLTELWSIFDFLNPGYLGSLNQFRSRFVNPIERTRDAELTAAVQRLVQPFLLRREKRDPAVELDLPDKLESKLYVPLTAEQAALYEATVQKMLHEVDHLSQMQRRGAILTTLMKLKQICNHPVVFMKEGVTNRAPLSEQAWSEVIARSEKLARLLEMVSELRAEGDKCLIFTQFVETGKLIQSALSQELDEEVLFLHGSVSKPKRDEMIDRFQSGPSRQALPDGGEASDMDGPMPSPGVLVLSLKAGGVGLNLTAASHVFHFDRWWNPAVENQATDRAYRIGQEQRVQVYKFVTLGTLEERIDEMLEAKQSLSNQIIGTGENWITELSTDDLRTMFALRREWVEE